MDKTFFYHRDDVTKYGWKRFLLGYLAGILTLVVLAAIGLLFDI